MTEPPNHHAPFPVEVNGPANIVSFIDIAEHLGNPPNIEAIRQEACETIDYLKAIGNGFLPAWHELDKKTNKRPSRAEIWKAIVKIHSVKNNGDASKTLNDLCEILYIHGAKP